MNLLPQPLLKIAEGIAVDLPEDKQKDFLETVKQAADGKNLSHVHWAFLGSELRSMPNDLPEHIQALIDKVITVMDRLAAGEHWTDTSATLAEVDVAFSKECVAIASYVLSAISVLKNTADALRAVDGGAEAVCAADTSAYAAASVAYAEAAYSKTCANSAAREAYAEARCRQRAALLEVIESAPCGAVN